MVNKRIAVTGGRGFLGSSTLDEIWSRGHEGWAFDRSEGNDVLGSLDNLRGATTVIHLAGILGTSELFDRPEDAVDVNIKGTLRILEWCRENDASFVGITMLPVFPSVYTATKVCAQNLAHAWHKAYGVPVSHVRAFNAYGPKQPYGSGHPQKIVPTFSTLGWENKPLPVWGDGLQTMDLVRVEDVARMLVDAVDFGNGETFDAGTGYAITVKQFAEFVIETTGSTGSIEYLPMRLGEEPTNVVASQEGWELLDWNPRFNWNDVKDTIWKYLNG